MTWFRRAREAATPDEDDPADRPDALVARVFELVHDVNNSAGRLPTEATVVARRVLDAVREVVVSAGDRPLSIHAVIAVRGILDDYLPTTLHAYLALAPEVVGVRRPSGRTPTESFVEQLDVLWGSAMDVLDASGAQDADALLSQGNFLRTKFAGSDLDL